MKCQDLKPFASGNVPAGYFGVQQNVKYALIDKDIVLVAKCGYYRLSLPKVESEDEAISMLRNHPCANHCSVDTLEG